MMKKQRKKNNDTKRRMKGRYFAVIAAAFAILVAAVYLSNPAVSSDASVAPVEEAAVEELQAAETADVGEVVRAMRSIEASRRESRND